jgi:hypothetical protein
MEPNCTIPHFERCQDGTLEPNCTIPHFERCRDGTIEPDCRPPAPATRCPNGTIEPTCSVPPRVCPDRDNDCEHQPVAWGDSPGRRGRRGPGAAAV